MYLRLKLKLKNILKLLTQKNSLFFSRKHSLWKN